MPTLFDSVLRYLKMFALAALLGLSLPIAAVTTLDPSFGANGTVVYHLPDGLNPFPPSGSGVSSVFAKRDGNILAYGSYIRGHSHFGAPFYQQAVLQFSPEGSPDLSFGTQGQFNSSEFQVPLVQRDDKAFVQTPTGLTRLNSDGSLDQGFVTTVGIGGPLAQQADGKIVIADPGSGGGPVIARVNVDGSPDPSFNVTGTAAIPPGDSLGDTIVGLIIQHDGKIVVAAQSTLAAGLGTTNAFALIRFNPDGTPDSTFGNDGRATTTGVLYPNVADFPSGVVLQPNGRLVVFGYEVVFSASGSLPAAVLLVGFTPGGVVDSSFGTAGAVRISPAGGGAVHDVKVQTDGRLLVAFNAIAVGMDSVMRLTFNGLVDTTFGNVGVISSPELPSISSIALQPDGNLLLGGSATNASSTEAGFALQRYLSGPSAVIEFYNASLDHYFISMDPQEVADLDLGVHGGWARTGQSFAVFGSLAAAKIAEGGVASNPVCRFYIPPEHGDSHFFSSDLFECQQASKKSLTDPNFSGYVEETASAFFVAFPNFLTGACPSGTIPIYRLWNARFDSNHRYTTNQAIKAQMVARGYVAEGYGPNAVNMCAPQ